MKTLTAWLCLIAGLSGSLVANAAHAAPSVTVIDSLAITGLSADGTVACGNTVDGLFEAARWTEAEGVVRLGRSSVALTGRGAGLPGISADGNSVGSTIASSDSLVTQGIWTKGIGWQETIPPLPADGGSVDDSYGSAWGISGDGSTVVGLYWRLGATDGIAHASAWNPVDGLVDLGSQGHDSRANGANHDGSVVVGWSASVVIQYVWQPTVWDENGITVRVEGGLMFASGSDQLRPEATPVMERVSALLGKYTFDLYILGHTDSVPIRTSRFPSNWELSSARATATLRHLVAQGADPQRLVAVGFADSRPIDRNDSPEGRERNRRVEFLFKNPESMPSGGFRPADPG